MNWILVECMYVSTCVCLPHSFSSLIRCQSALRLSYRVWCDKLNTTNYTDYAPTELQRFKYTHIARLTSQQANDLSVLEIWAGKREQTDRRTNRPSKRSLPVMGIREGNRTVHAVTLQILTNRRKPTPVRCLSWPRSANKKLSYRRGTARCVVSIEILPIATQQCRNYLYDKSWPNRWYEVGDLVGGNAW